MKIRRTEYRPRPVVLTTHLSLPRPPNITEISVRINPPSSGLAELDLSAALSCSYLDSIIIPKVERPQDIDFVVNYINSSNHPLKHAIRVVALLESARAVMDVGDIARKAQEGRLDGLVFGAEDFGKDLGVGRTRGLSEFAYARQRIVLAARAWGVQDVLDCVCTEVDDGGVLEEECVRGKAWGFTGKQVVHPGQVGVVQRVFGPEEGEVRDAVRVLVGDERAGREGRGSWRLEGKMVDRPVVERAMEVVERARGAGWGGRVKGWWREAEGEELK